jgi:1-deoxy-D-xylulose-5-phosphate reductoisomerase
VAAFLARQTGFLEIARSVAETLERMDAGGELAPKDNDPVEAAMAVDGIARRRAAEVLSRLEPVT